MDNGSLSTTVQVKRQGRQRRFKHMALFLISVTCYMGLCPAAVGGLRSSRYVGAHTNCTKAKAKQLALLGICAKRNPHKGFESFRTFHKSDGVKHHYEQTSDKIGVFIAGSSASVRASFLSQATCLACRKRGDLLCRGNGPPLYQRSRLCRLFF